MLKWLKSRFTITETIYVEYRPHNEYKLVRGKKYAMHKGHTDHGGRLYQYGEFGQFPLVCEWKDYLEIVGPSQYTVIAITTLDPDAPITSSLLQVIP